MSHQITYRWECTNLKCAHYQRQVISIPGQSGLLACKVCQDFMERGKQYFDFNKYNGFKK